MLKEHKQSEILHEVNEGFISVGGFNLMKSECHEINMAVVLFVKGGRNTQEKTKTTTFSYLFFLSRGDELPTLGTKGSCSTD